MSAPDPGTPRPQEQDSPPPGAPPLHNAVHREHEEPHEANNPVSLFLIFLFAILMMWGGFYLSQYSGGFRHDVYDYQWTPGQDAAAAVPFDPIARGNRLYRTACAQCHQANGEGLPGAFPPLAGSEWLIHTPELPIKILLLGMQGPITVKGNAYDGNMPAHGTWKDRDIAAILTYVRQEWGNAAPPVSEEQVRLVRESLGPRTQPWTAPELLEIYPAH